MIVTITGLPGAGKTLWALTWVKAKAEKEKREVFYSGIKDLKLPWTEIDPEKWMDCPPGSIVVVDECQRVFRPRSHGTQVPKHVSDLETHRHIGIDLVFITQHPMLIESNVRRLCGLHFHAVRKWGTQAATVHEWGAIKENCDKSRDDSQRHAFKYPKANYGLYHSAEVHTHKVRLPYHLLFIAAVPLAVGYAGWRIYSNWFPQAKAGEVQQLQQKPGVIAQASAGQVKKTEGLTRAEYIAQFDPRVSGLAYTAPAYDDVTKPQQAPYPAACVQSSTRCSCYTQQGTALETTPELCKGIVKGGFFIAWDKPVVQAVPVHAPVAPLVALPGHISLGGTPNGSMSAPQDNVTGKVEQDSSRVGRKPSQAGM